MDRADKDEQKNGGTQEAPRQAVTQHRVATSQQHYSTAMLGDLGTKSIIVILLLQNLL